MSDIPPGYDIAAARTRWETVYGRDPAEFDAAVADTNPTAPTPANPSDSFAATVGIPASLVSAVQDRALQVQQELASLDPVARQLAEASLSYEGTRNAAEVKAAEAFLAAHSENPWVKQIKATGALRDPYVAQQLALWAQYKAAK
jgi:hypothetical protein